MCVCVCVCVWEKATRHTHTHIDNTHTHTQWQQQQQQCALVPSATDSNTMGSHQAPFPLPGHYSTSPLPPFSQSTANRNYAKLIVPLAEKAKRTENLVSNSRNSNSIDVCLGYFYRTVGLPLRDCDSVTVCLAQVHFLSNLPPPPLVRFSRSTYI